MTICAGRRNCNQPKTFTESNFVLHIARGEQALAPSGDCLSVEDSSYDDLVSGHVTGMFTKYAV